MWLARYIAQKASQQTEIILSELRTPFLGFAFSESLTCQYTLAKSKVENQAWSLKELSDSSIRGSGKASFFVSTFRRRIVHAEAGIPVVLCHKYCGR